MHNQLKIEIQRRDEKKIAQRNTRSKNWGFSKKSNMIHTIIEVTVLPPFLF
jgi:hypothetical protein